MNIKTINLAHNNIADEYLLPLVEAIRGHCNCMLEELILFRNEIGNSGCIAGRSIIQSKHPLSCGKSNCYGGHDA